MGLSFGFEKDIGFLSTVYAVPALLEPHSPSLHGARLFAPLDSVFRICSRRSLILSPCPNRFRPILLSRVMVRPCLSLYKVIGVAAMGPGIRGFVRAGIITS